MKLKLTEWAAIAEIVGAAAVVASLIFVGLQLGENSREVRAATYQAVTDNELVPLIELARSAELGLTYRAFMAAPETLDEAALFQANNLATVFLRAIENAYEQWRAGVLSEDRWASVRGMLDEILLTKGYVCYFAIAGNAQLFIGSYRHTVIDPILERSPFSERVDECPETLRASALGSAFGDRSSIE